MPDNKVYAILLFILAIAGLNEVVSVYNDSFEGKWGVIIFGVLFSGTLIYFAIGKWLKK